MKKYCIILLSALAALSCSKEGVDELRRPSVVPAATNLAVRAAMSGDDTRLGTDDGLTFTIEEGTEQIGVYVETPGVATVENMKFTAGTADENGWVSFSPASDLHVQSTSKIYAYAPYTATTVDFHGTVESGSDDSETRADWDGLRTINLPSSQTQTATNEVKHLADYYAIVATPASPVASREALDNYTVDLQFSGVFALVRFVLLNDETSPVTVSQLVFRSEGASLSGNFSLNLKEENPSLSNADYAPQAVEGKTSDSVSVTLTTPVEIAPEAQAELYAVVNACTLPSATIEVYGTYEGNDVVFTKNLTDKTITRKTRAAFGMKLKDGKVVVNAPAYDEATKTYTISNVNELTWVAEQTNGGNNFSGYNFVLANDIDLNNMAWTPIGTASNSFAGVFDGAGHTVSNLAIDNAELSYAGLFGRLISPGVLKNLTIDNASVKAHAQVGALSGGAYTGKIENCHVKGLIQIEGTYQTGGLAGSGYATISQCSVIGDAGSYVKGVYERDNFEGDAIGGIIGYACEKNSTENKVISDCEARIDVTGSRKVGGIAGQCGKDANIYNCRYTGNVATTASEEYIAANAGKIMVGGIVGELTGTTLFIKESTITSGSTVTGVDRNTTGLILGGSRTAGHQLTEENNTSEGAVLIVPSDGFDETADGYVITSEAGLEIFAGRVNGGEDFAGTTITLAADLDLKNSAWTPIGTREHGFAGIFDGAGHTISNLTVNNTESKALAGLFGWVSGTVKDFTIDGAAISSTNTTGGYGTAVAVALGYPSAKIENITVKNASIDSHRQTGGIVGYLYGTVSGCTVSNSTITVKPNLANGVYDNGDKVGGIVGFMGGDSGICFDNTVTGVDIIAYRDAGGVTGILYGGSVPTFKNNNIADSSVTLDNTNVCVDPWGNAGAIVGRYSGTTADAVDASNTATNVTVTIPAAKWTGDTKEPAYDEATKTYTVSEGAELAWIAEQVNGGNNLSGTTIVLSSDIDLDNVAWTPIGTETNAFAGTFDGAGHTVSNLSTNLPEQQFVGLFGRSVSPAVLKNVTVENAEVKGLGRVGALVGSAFTGKIDNCHVSGLIKLDSNYQAGGITGYGYASISNCSVIGDAGSYVQSTYKTLRSYEGDSAGGIIGYAGEEGSTTNAVISNCEVRIDVIGDRKVGGIVGQAGENANVDNCTYAGNVSLNTSSTTSFLYGSWLYIGGIVGELTGATLFIKNCTVESGSTVIGKKANLTGAVIGGSRTSGYQVTEENNTTEGVTVTTK